MKFRGLTRGCIFLYIPPQTLFPAGPLVIDQYSISGIGARSNFHPKTSLSNLLRRRTSSAGISKCMTCLTAIRFGDSGTVGYINREISHRTEPSSMNVSQPEGRTSAGRYLKKGGIAWVIAVVLV